MAVLSKPCRPSSSDNSASSSTLVDPKKPRLSTIQMDEIVQSELKSYGGYGRHLLLRMPDNYGYEEERAIEDELLVEGEVQTASVDDESAQDLRGSTHINYQARQTPVGDSEHRFTRRPKFYKFGDSNFKVDVKWWHFLSDFAEREEAAVNSGAKRGGKKPDAKPQRTMRQHQASMLRVPTDMDADEMKLFVKEQLRQEYEAHVREEKQWKLYYAEKKYWEQLPGRKRHGIVISKETFAEYCKARRLDAVAAVMRRRPC